MIDRPILMNGAMVRATLREVDPKRQTRRIVKIPDFVRGEPSDYDTPAECNDATTIEWATAFGDFKEDGFRAWMTEYPEEGAIQINCPHGKVGDRLWVRENGWERPERTPKMMREGADTWEPYYFDADGYTDIDHEQFKEWGFKRRPSIHMPRWASRILLEIVSVRVERLQDISEKDAEAEGVKCETADPMFFHVPEPGNVYAHADDSPIGSYRKLWETINGPGSWDANPWVWVIEFRVVKS